MARQAIGIGAAANDGTGDPLRTAFTKANDNFSEIYTLLGGETLTVDGARTALGLGTTNSPTFAGVTLGALSSINFTGLTANALLLSDGTDLTQDGTNLLYTTASGPRLQVGSGGATSTGLILGYSGTSGRGAIYASSVTPDATNHALQATSSFTVLNAKSTGIYFTINDVTTKMFQGDTAGAGPSITAGVATTDVNALSATQTWNAAGVNFKANKTVVTPTAAASGSLLESWEYNTGQGIGVAQLTELTTINAAATTDTAIQIPANAIVLGVSVRVTTVIPTAATFTVTGTTSGTAFQTGASVSTAANTTDAGTKSCPFLNATAQTIRITPNAQPADNTGRVRVTIHYLVITPPTS